MVSALVTLGFVTSYSSRSSTLTDQHDCHKCARNTQLWGSGWNQFRGPTWSRSCSGPSQQTELPSSFKFSAWREKQRTQSANPQSQANSGLYSSFLISGAFWNTPESYTSLSDRSEHTTSEALENSRWLKIPREECCAAREMPSFSSPRVVFPWIKDFRLITELFWCPHLAVLNW